MARTYTVREIAVLLEVPLGIIEELSAGLPYKTVPPLPREAINYTGTEIKDWLKKAGLPLVALGYRNVSANSFEGLGHGV